MKNMWSSEKAGEFVSLYREKWGENLSLRVFSSRLLGGERGLVLHGGGNTSVKGKARNVFGEQIDTVCVKASGYELSTIEPQGFVGLSLVNLLSLRELDDLSDEEVMCELRRSFLQLDSPMPTIEALLHAFLAPKFIDHTHSNAILALTNRKGGKKIVQEALGNDVIILDYFRPGFSLAKVAVEAFERKPSAKGMVLLKHGLVTWGDSAKESYEKTIELVSRAEEYIEAKAEPIILEPSTSKEEAKERYRKVAPILRGLLALSTGDPDWPYDRFILKSLHNREMLELFDSSKGKEIALTPPLTSDHLIRTKAFPLWIDNLGYEDEEALREELKRAIEDFANTYEGYVRRFKKRMPQGVDAFDAMPRVMLIPGLGAVCAGRNAREAEIARDITGETLGTKMRTFAIGSYEGLSEEHLFDMEYLPLQHAKLLSYGSKILSRSVALVTGAGGAIGCGICEGLLEEGCHVAAADVSSEKIDSLEKELRTEYPGRIRSVLMDVSDPVSVAQGFSKVIEEWGGVDIVIPNAGLAHASAIAEMDLEAFRKLELVNVEGTLNVLSEAARLFKVQNTGGDIVVVSSKNVFAPGAGFGAYSATKAAAHQLARIASKELASIDVRVNMVSPDAVFSHGGRRSGLWAEVGPERMRSRGLDEKGLEEYYRKRNLLKARVTARHVANAVLFFVTRRTPTTGTTIPVDGGIPDATPR